MRKLVLKIDMSIDAFVGAMDGNDNWIFSSGGEPYITWLLDLLAQTGTQIVGGKTAQDMAAYWPKSDEPLAKPMNEQPKVVFSKSLKHIDWNNARIERGDLVEEVNRLKQQDGKNLLVFGGSRFVQSLAQNHLIDEYCLVTHPTALGSGKPLFTQLSEPLNLELVDILRFEKGAFAQIYRPA